MTKLNIGTKATSTKEGKKEKIAQLAALIEKGKLKGKKLITAKRNLAWYKSDLKNNFRKKKSSKKKAKKTVRKTPKKVVKAVKRLVEIQGK